MSATPQTRPTPCSASSRVNYLVLPNPVIRPRHTIRPPIYPCQPPPLPLSARRPIWPPPAVSTCWRRPLSSTVNPGYIIPGHINVHPQQDPLASIYTVTCMYVCMYSYKFLKVACKWRLCVLFQPVDQHTNFNFLICCLFCMLILRINK
jgi:hypothetical protein